MTLTAKEAQELMPREYTPTDQICERIQLLAKAGLDYFWTDLTKGQESAFQDLGYRVEFNEGYRTPYKISWKK